MRPAWVSGLVRLDAMPAMQCASVELKQNSSGGMEVVFATFRPAPFVSLKPAVPLVRDGLGWLRMRRRGKFSHTSRGSSKGQEAIMGATRDQPQDWGTPASNQTGKGVRPRNWRKMTPWLDPVPMDWRSSIAASRESRWGRKP